LGAYFRTGYSLSEREREIAVVIINSSPARLCAFSLIRVPQHVR
jgi:hypothetical protein